MKKIYILEKILGFINFTNGYKVKYSISDWPKATTKGVFWWWSEDMWESLGNRQGGE